MLCNTCKNESICKFCEDMKKAEYALQTFDAEFNSPVSVNATCKKHEKKTEKQDGVYFR